MEQEDRHRQKLRKGAKFIRLAGRDEKLQGVFRYAVREISPLDNKLLLIEHSWQTLFHVWTKRRIITWLVGCYRIHHVIATWEKPISLI